MVIAAGLVFFPILGNLRPDLVSFLPSMRQYAGNWASAQGHHARRGAQARGVRGAAVAGTSSRSCRRPATPEDVAEVVLSLTTGWRSMHSQGPGLMSVLLQRGRRP